MMRTGVVGWPIAHSRSPLIHGHWLKEHGLEGRYDRIPLEPDRADAFFATFADQGLVGCNVTIPYKEIAASHVRHLSPVAARLGAVNTLWLEDGALCGTNTDVDGFLGNLDARVPGWDTDPAKALVLGAGGAAKAVVDGLVARGFAVDIANRTFARAEALAARYPGKAHAHPVSETNRLLEETSLVVNTTSLGMKGEGEVDIDFSRAGPDTIAADIVYVPLVTPFLASAASRGLRTVDGLGMLLHQAVPGFERWYGVRPTVTAELRALVEADL